MNTGIIGSARSLLALQKAFLAIVLVVLAMAVFNMIPATRSEFFT